MRPPGIQLSVGQAQRILSDTWRNTVRVLEDLSESDSKGNFLALG